MSAKALYVERFVRVEFSNSGPRLYVGGVEVRSWVGCAHDGEAIDLARKVNSCLTVDAHNYHLEQVHPKITSEKP